MQRLAVGEDIGFGQLVEAVDEELHDEDEQEDGGHLEEQPEIARYPHRDHSHATNAAETVRWRRRR